MYCITVVLTCYNRKKYTIKCLNSLVKNNPNVLFKFIVVDDCSVDGTEEALMMLPYYIQILRGNGKLYWNGGMSLGLEYLRNHEVDVEEYVMLVNDDVIFNYKSIEKLIELHRQNPRSVCIGTMCDENGRLTYGGIRFISKSFIKYCIIDIDENVDCDTFNANCVLIPKEIFLGFPDIDKRYIHSLGDFDYGLSLKRRGVKLIHSKEYTGICADNPVQGSWRDASLKRIQRLKLKESPKGLPYKDWFYFGRKNFGLFTAIYHFITPYIRILFGI